MFIFVGVGHWAVDCVQDPSIEHLQNIKCYNCAAYGHFEKDCPHGNMQTTLNVFTLFSSLEQVC